ncbi:MAG: Fungal specific transcription factor [Thelocarpon impressellum]|nr:MAG: Fungal specific transcription factor [Thelocarpon impressellum]
MTTILTPLCPSTLASTATPTPAFRATVSRVGPSHEPTIPAMASRTAAEAQAKERSSARNRTDRPCDACRRRKSRCVLQEDKGVCLQCENTKQACTFVESPRPRKRPSSNEDPGSEKAKKSNRRSPERQTLARPLAQNSLPSHSGGTSLAVKDSNAKYAGTTQASRPAGDRSSSNVRHIGPTSEVETCLLELSPFDQENESGMFRGGVRKVSETDMYLLLPDRDARVRSESVDCRRPVEAAVFPHGPALVDLYFEYVHPNFPILQRTTFLEDYRAGAAAIATPLLAAVYIVASAWRAHDSRTRDAPEPDVTRLVKLALGSLADAMDRPDVSTIQAGLILLQRRDGESWPLTSQLISVGQELGIHLDCSSWRISESERGQRKRLAWALFMQDKWGSLTHGRPSHIARHNWLVPLLTTQDFEWDRSPADGDASAADEERAGMLFSQLASLTVILSDVLDTLYSLQAMREVDDAGMQGTRMILERAKPIQMKLKDWFTRLPGPLRLDNNNINKSLKVSSIGKGTGALDALDASPASDRSGVGYLHLAYFATEITLHRRIIRSLSLVSTDPYLAHICRSAAKTRLISAMDFVNRLKREHLQSFWYFPSRVNFALIGTFGSLLRATAPSKEEADFYRLRLGEYKWTLTASSKTAGFMEFAVDHLDSCGRLLQDLEKSPISATRRNLEEAARGLAVPHAPHLMPPQDPQRPDLLDHSSADPSSTNSGLASPSTSTSGDSEGYRAYMAPDVWSAGLAQADPGFTLMGMEGVVPSHDMGANPTFSWS